MSTRWYALLGRAAFFALVPALALPPIAASASSFGERASTGTAGLTSVIVSGFMFVLLGSMALNAWLLLRHPQTFTDRTMPREVAMPFALLVVVLVVWIIVLAAGGPSITLYVFDLVVITLSIVVCVQAGFRLRHRMPLARVTATTLPTVGRVLAIAYLVITVAVLMSTLLGSVFGLSALGSVLGTLPLMALGLPWSWPTAIVWFVLATQVPGSSGFVAVAPALPAIANVVIVVLVVWNPAARTRIANWFFRLARSADPGAPGT